MFNLTEITNKKLDVSLKVKGEENTDINLTAEVDDDGKGVLRVIDAAPFAYDPAKDVLKVDQTGKRSGYFQVVTIQTITQLVNRFQLTALTGLTEDEIRNKKNMTIYLFDSHNQGGKFWIEGMHKAANAFNSNANLYFNATELTNGTDYRTLQPFPITGAGTGVKQMPLLQSVFSDLRFAVEYTEIPTTGTLTIGVDIQW